MTDIEVTRTISLNIDNVQHEVEVSLCISTYIDRLDADGNRGETTTQIEITSIDAPSLTILGYSDSYIEGEVEEEGSIYDVDVDNSDAYEE